MGNELTIGEETPIRAIITPPGNFQEYMQRLIRASDEAVEEAEHKLAKAETWENSEEIAEAHAALEAAQRLGGQEGHDQQVHWRWELQSRSRKKKIRLAKMTRALSQALSMRDALRSGYVPLPRLPAIRMDRVHQIMPPDVLDAFAEAKDAGVFEEFRVINGGNADRYGNPREGRIAPKVDPILVGMIGSEMFAIAWWR